MRTTSTLLKRPLLTTALLSLFATGVFGAGADTPKPSVEYFKIQDMPVIKLSGDVTDVSNYQYMGTWGMPDNKDRQNAWRESTSLNFDKTGAILQIAVNGSKLDGASRKLLTPDTEAATFAKIGWGDNQASFVSFNGLSPRKQTALLEIDTDDIVILYINGKFVRGMSAAGNVELGTNLLIPVSLEKGDNIFIMGIVSSGSPPRIRMSLRLDQSKDFQAAWGNSWGFLSKLIYSKEGDTFETPSVKWDLLLGGMTVGAEVSDAVSGRTLFKREELRNGNVIRDAGKALGEGIYKITYAAKSPGQETATESFLIGAPQKVFGAIKAEIEKLSWDAGEELDIEPQLRRAEILLDKSNYDAASKAWQEKIIWTLSCLAEFVHLKSEKEANIFNGLKGLNLMGFVSRIDDSKQFYRLFIPSNYTPDKKLPLLLIMPTSMAARERPFVESPFLAAHRNAVQICRFAEKFGFGVLWPGYRNAPEGWTYETTRSEEALSDVERNYNIDSSRISLYGICSGGFFAGRLAATYPNRYAAIVYDRAIFERETEDMPDVPDSIKQWLKTIDPVDGILGNANIKILVLNDGSKIEGHGEIELSRKFLDRALLKRPDIKYSLGQRKMGVSLWDSIFEFLNDCKNEHPDHARIDIPAGNGYTGPISEVFAAPFIVVEGTSTDRKGTYFMNLAINNLVDLYKNEFYGAEFAIKKDTEVTDEELEKYNLVLLGNAESNAIWGKLATKYPDAMTPYSLPDAKKPIARKEAFAEVFRNPCNRGNYLLLMGSSDLENLALLKNIDPFKAWFDCFLHEDVAGFQRQHVFARRPDMTKPSKN